MSIEKKESINHSVTLSQLENMLCETLSFFEEGKENVVKLNAIIAVCEHMKTLQKKDL